MEYGYDCLALTDTNLCGALDFARQANALGLWLITGGELTLACGSRLTLLARTREGYGNLSRLSTLANATDRRNPSRAPRHLPQHAAGLTLLTSGRDGPLSVLLEEGRRPEALRLLRHWMDCFGPDVVYVELQRNFLEDDARHNRELCALARDAGASVIATNDVHYHAPERCRLQHSLAAASRNTTIDQALRYIRPNHHLCLKPPADMEHCSATAPKPSPTPGASPRPPERQPGLQAARRRHAPWIHPDSYLQQLCYEATVRRYGSVTQRVAERLREEFRLIERHNLAGFLLLYREIVLLAQQIMEEWGLAHPETPLEERPPGRGRGSSVALLVGYLTGISHVDPLRWGLILERLISEDTSLLPDIDLDFPRQLRDDLIRRVHQRFGPEFAVLAGAVSTYQVKGVIQDLGKALGCPGRSFPCCPSSSIPMTPPHWRPGCGSCPTSGARPTPPAGATCWTWRPSSCTRPAAWGSTWAAWCSAALPSRRWCPPGPEPWRAATSWTGTRTAWPMPVSPRSTCSPCRCWTS